jgi:hypothetical protein
MFTEHVNIPKGVVNGATTTITSIVLDPQNNVTSIEVQLTNNSTKMISKNIPSNSNIHMMDIFIKHHFQ